MEIYVFIDGAKKSLTQLAAESGVNYDTLLARYKAGVPADHLVPKKESGESGSQGEQGPQGEPGPPGEQGPPGAPGPGFETLWVNASPESDFAPQTLALDLSAYDFVAIFCNYNPSTNVYGTNLCPVNGLKMGLSVPAYASSIFISMREAVVETTGITFGAGHRQSLAAGSVTKDNGNCLPLAVHGIRRVE